MTRWDVVNLNFIGKEMSQEELLASNLQ